MPGRAMAQAPNDFGRVYGLLVSSLNKDQPVPRDRGIQVIRNFFADGLLMDVSGNSRFLTQRDFLTLFEKRRQSMERNSSPVSDDVLYRQFWLRARRMNWLQDTRLTYATMQDFLYRYSVSRAHGGIPYFTGLVLDESEINPRQFSSIGEVKYITRQLTNYGGELSQLVHPTKADLALRQKLDRYRQDFGTLEAQLETLYSPLNLIPDLPADIREKIVSNDLGEILSQISYNYSRNPANRIYNLLAGLSKISGRVYQPGDVIDITNELGRDGWGTYKYGWVLFEGTEAWQFGGGLCGAATATFTPSWWAGLEVLTRFAHSSLYRSLYPKESLGLDATIYRGHKNLVMRNNLNSPVLYYVKNDPEKMEFTLYVIGNSPYANVQIEGPTLIGRNAYKWVRRMEGFDGKVTEEQLVTRYSSVF